MTENSSGKKRFQLYLSLQAQLIFSLVLLLTVFFAGLGYWFIDFTVGQTYDQIKQGLDDTLTGAAAGVNGDELEQLKSLVPTYKEDTDYKSPEYQKSIESITSNPLYQKQLDWLKTVHQIEPRGFPYIFAKGYREHEAIFLTDVWKLDPVPENRE